MESTTAPTVIARADDLRIVCLTDAFASLLQAPPDEIMGRSLASILPWRREDLDAARRATLRGGRHGCAIALPSGETWHAWLVGIRRRVDASAAFLIAAFRPEAALAARCAHADPEARFRVLVHSVREYAIILLDPSGAIASWNLGAERIYGYGSADIVGCPVDCLYTREDRQAGRPQTALARAVAEGMCEEEGWRVRRDGAPVWANAVTTALRDGTGGLTGFARVVRDLTSRRRADQEVRRAELADQRTSTIYDTLQLGAHELRNPMSAVLGAIQMIRAGGADTNLLLGVVYDEVGRMDRMLAHLSRTVAMAGPAGPPPSGVRVRIDLTEVVATVVRAHWLAVARSVEVVHGQAPVWVLVDPDGIRQVLDNVLSNALKYSAPETAVVVRVHGDGRLARVSVQDRGCGVPAGDVDRVFDRFVRVAVGANGPPGLGLGLYVCRRIMEQHGGRIWLESAEGAGTTVHLELAAAAAGPQGPAE